MYHEGHGIWEQALQCNFVQIVGWFLWSFRRLDSNLLAKELNTLYNINVAFRYTNIMLGSGKKEILSAPTKALHIVTPTKEYDKCKQIIYKVFHRSATEFPIHMKLTFVPLAASISSPEGFKLLVKQKTKQGIFTDMMAKSFAMNFEILHLDRITDNLPSLQTIIMSIKSKEYVDQSLFVSVDSDFKNTNQVNFSFIPAVQHEARQFISNMVPTLLNKYSDQKIDTYFQAEAVLRGQNCAWDRTTQTVINSDEAYLQTFQKYEDDFLADKYDISCVQLSIHPDTDYL